MGGEADKVDDEEEDKKHKGIKCRSWKKIASW